MELCSKQMSVETGYEGDKTDCDPCRGDKDTNDPCKCDIASGDHCNESSQRRGNTALTDRSCFKEYPGLINRAGNSTLYACNNSRENIISKLDIPQGESFHTAWTKDDYLMFDLSRIHEIITDIISDVDYKTLSIEYMDSAEYVLYLLQNCGF